MRGPISIWIVTGPILGAGGDVALMFKGQRSFLAGLVSFLLGHAASAIAVYVGHSPLFSDTQALLLLLGALLFFVSDIAVAKSRFVKSQLRDRMWGLPAYYSGQLLIAWSLLT